MDNIAKASPRTVQMNLGQSDLSVDMDFPRLIELNFEQYFYAENSLLYAARREAEKTVALKAAGGIMSSI